MSRKTFLSVQTTVPQGNQLLEVVIQEGNVHNEQTLGAVNISSAAPLLLPILGLDGARLLLVEL